MPGEKCTEVPFRKQARSKQARSKSNVRNTDDQLETQRKNVVSVPKNSPLQTVGRLMDTDMSSTSSPDDKSSNSLVSVLISETPSPSKLNNLESPDSMQLFEDVNESASDTLIVTQSDIDVTIVQNKPWSFGTWGSLLVQLKKMNTDEVHVLRTCIHPNVIPFMGLFADVDKTRYIITERYIGSLYAVLHDQVRLLPVSSAIRYVLDITNALIFLQLRGYLHSKINSSIIMITSYDTAKLGDLSACVRSKKNEKFFLKVYSVEPQYINIEGNEASEDCQPLISQDSSEEYIKKSCVTKDYILFKNCQHYQWLAPELFAPDFNDVVNVCSKTDVFSLCLVLWEAFNVNIPWATLSYSQLQEQYLIKKSGIELPQDGTYPGTLLSLLQEGLQLNINSRTDLKTFHKNLQNLTDTMCDDQFREKPIPKCEQQIKSTENNFNASYFEDSNHEKSLQLDESNKENKIATTPENCLHKDNVNFNESQTFGLHRNMTYNYSSTPSNNTGDRLYRSDSTEYCGIMSPDDDRNEESKYSSPAITSRSFTSKSRCKLPEFRNRLRYASKNSSIQEIKLPEEVVNSNHTEKNEEEEHVKENKVSNQSMKLITSITPNSYKPLSINIPEFSLDPLRLGLRDQDANNTPDYKFNISDCVLPSNSIARKNMILKNAWLSGRKSPKAKSSNGFHNRDAETTSLPDQNDLTLAQDGVFGFAGKEGENSAKSKSHLTFVSINRRKSHERYRNDIMENGTVRPLISLFEEKIQKENDPGRCSSIPEYTRLKKSDFGIGTSLPKLNMFSSETQSNLCEANRNGQVKTTCDVAVDTMDLLRYDTMQNRKRREKKRQISNCSLHYIPKDMSNDLNKTGEIICDNEIQNSFNERDKKHISHSNPMYEDESNTTTNEHNASFDSTMHRSKCCNFSVKEENSTEDLYIDDDILTEVHEDFGGKLKMFPVLGSIHELECEKKNDCCLIKFKKEHGYDSIYFYDNYINSKDAVDGICNTPEVVCKRRVSVINNVLHRIMPKEGWPFSTRSLPKTFLLESKIRPVPEKLFPHLSAETRTISSSTPSLHVRDSNEVEFNIDLLQPYQNSSEEFLACDNDIGEFERMEKKIEEETKNNNKISPHTYGCLENISEEYLSNIS